MARGKSRALNSEARDVKCFISLGDQLVLEDKDAKRMFKQLVLQNNTGNELKYEDRYCSLSGISYSYFILTYFYTKSLQHKRKKSHQN